VLTVVNDLLRRDAKRPWLWRMVSFVDVEAGCCGTDAGARTSAWVSSQADMLAAAMEVGMTAAARCGLSGLAAGGVVAVVTGRRAIEAAVQRAALGRVKMVESEREKSGLGENGNDITSC
jgi:hypothetical protein